MEHLHFSKDDMVAIIHLAKMMVAADGKVHPNEGKLMKDESLRFGISPIELARLIEQTSHVKAENSLARIAAMTDSQKKYVTAYLGALMAVDGDINDKEMALWSFVSLICGLPTMNIADAIVYITTLDYSNEDNPKIGIFQSLIQGSNNPSEGSITFSSNTHQRYENGMPTRGEQNGCHRDIVIEKNISGNIGYSVSVKNPDAIPGSWGATPMGTKPMKIISTGKDKVELRGYGYDTTAVSMGVPMSDATFENYGMTIHHNGSEVTKCIIHLIERNVDIDYYVK